jgi:hypothetical protein
MEVNAVSGLEVTKFLLDFAYGQTILSTVHHLLRNEQVSFAVRNPGAGSPAWAFVVVAEAVTVRRRHLHIFHICVGRSDDSRGRLGRDIQ